MRRSVEALRDELLVAVLHGMNHTVPATRGCSVFGWGEAKGLGLPEAAAAQHVLGGSIMLPGLYPQLVCALRR